MDEIIALEGSDDDLCRILLSRGLVPRDRLEGLVRERRVLASGGAAVPALKDQLVRDGLLHSRQEFEALRVQTKALAKCARCGAFHAIYLHWPASTPSCAKCGAALRPRLIQPGPPPLPGGETIVAPPPAGGESMLDLGTLPGLRPATAPESLTGGPAPGGGETMLGLGTLPGLRPGEAEPSPPPQTPQESLMGGGGRGGGETMLDLGTPATPVPAADTGRTVLDAERTPPPATAVPESSEFEPTVLLGSTPQTGSITAFPSDTPRSRSSPTHKTDPRGLEATPRTATGGGGGYSPTKSAPKEVQDAAKDPKRLFGKYVLVRELGRGGAGVVYKAWDTTLAQYVALKFIRDQDLGDSSTSTGSQAIEDFQREARMSAKLRHPTIIRIYELGCMSNRYYLSMDYIEGGSLFETIHGGKERNTDTAYNSDPRKYLEMMRKIIEAVHAAHSHAPPVIHRDLKPHNVLVDKSGTPYVVDFGLAKEVEISTSQHTMTGVVKGTPSYMAPEQAEGRNKDVDARTDVYSLGAILYELLTGRPPFVGGSVREVLNAICTQLPDRPNDAILKAQLEKATGTHRPRPVPKPLETICMKALEKAKPDRYPTAKDFADDLGRFLNDEDILAQEPGLYRRVRRKVRQHPLLSGGIAAAVLCAGVIGGSLYYTARRADTSGVEQLVSIAREHLAASNWSALETDAENLRKVDPGHPLIAEIEKAMTGHEADLERRRQAWAAGVARLRQESLPLVLDSLRAPFREAGELREQFDEPLRTTLQEVQETVETQARELVGSGPREGWLDEKVKLSARACRERIAHLQALGSDADFPFKAAAALGPLRDGLDQLLAYEGLWDLRVNVAPFARVTLRRGGRVVAEEWTPLGLRGLEVAGEYRVELAWSEPDRPERKLAMDLEDLRHGARVVLTGDMTQGDVRREP